MKHTIIRVFGLFLVLINSFPAAAQTKAVPQNNAQIQLSFAPVVKQVAPAVVNIYTKRTVTRAVSPFMNDPFFSQFFGRSPFGQRMQRQAENSLGSGVIVKSSGLVATNAHVVKGADEINVVLSDGREFDAKLIISDEASDLALLQMQTDETMPSVSLKPSEGLEVGDIVLAIGNPFGVGQTVTSGIVSAQGRSSLNINDFNFFIQTDAAINPGNSGGPLVALDGKLVGINTAIYSRDGGSSGIGFAIPSEMLASVMAAQESGAQNVVRPWFGVTSQDLTRDIGDSLAIDNANGALISKLHPQSPLKKAGIKVGDVITKFNGRAIRDSSEMKFRTATAVIGQSVEVGVLRAGQEMAFVVTAMAPPDKPPREETRLEGRHILNGITVANLNPAVAVELGIASTEEEAVIVMKAPRGSQGARFVKEADLILEINGKEIENVKDIDRALKRANGTIFALTLNRNGSIQQINLR